MLKSMREKKEKERKKERKDSPHFQNQSQRERGNTKEFKQKFKFHTLAPLDQSV